MPLNSNGTTTCENFTFQGKFNGKNTSLIVKNFLGVDLTSNSPESKIVLSNLWWRGANINHLKDRVQISGTFSFDSATIKHKSTSLLQRRFLLPAAEGVLLGVAVAAVLFSYAGLAVVPAICIGLGLAVLVGLITLANLFLPYSEGSSKPQENSSASLADQYQQDGSDLYNRLFNEQHGHHQGHQNRLYSDIASGNGSIGCNAMNFKIAPFDCDKRPEQEQEGVEQSKLCSSTAQTPFVGSTRP
jgi:hypothetical protein